MTPTKEDIKKWLKDSGKSREWLAEQCGVGKRVLDNWLSAARPVPSKALLIIQRLMTEKISPIPPQVEIDFTDEEWEVISAAMTATQQTFMEFINSAFRNALKDFADIALQNAAKEKEATRKKFTPVETFPAVAASLDYTIQVAGNTAAGKPSSGETVPQDIRIYRPLEWGEFVLRVNGKSMEPEIPDESLVIIKKYEDYLFPALGSLVVYNEGNDYTLKKLAKRKNPETGKMEYVLKSINPAYKDVEPIAEGKISGVYVETLANWEKA
ncbi:S24 family peptidase [Akkermansia sp.]|uniref:S24 family peptidase n=1 Tax=Akkermansia sp. TaxID=1872421 RepID=UPI003992C407